MRNSTTRLLLAASVLAGYGALHYAFVWSLTYYPTILIGVIAIGGIPVVILGVCYWGKEQERRSVWSNLRDLTKGDLKSVPSLDDKNTINAEAMFGGVRIKLLQMTVNQNGIRLDRPFVATRPLVIPWGVIQRLDLVDLSSISKYEDTDPVCRVHLKNSDRQLIISPWNRKLMRFIPETVGSIEQKPRRDL